ncbi:MAG: alkaline phosphatase family protein [Candidatus Thermoplasmatota archaeon]|nr:alkaline phosphatase family protein [Candidatus Thermoplasmatota archaeon]
MNKERGDDLESVIDKYRWEKHNEFVKPAFGKGCIMDIPGFILSSFGIGDGGNTRRILDMDMESPEHVIFLLIDGFGYSTMKYSSGKNDMKYLEDFLDRSSMRLITSVFPSTTSTATVSYHTNMLPVEHRILGYNSYIPEIGTVCNMISMSPVGRKDSCILDNGYEMPWIRKNGTVHSKLESNEVRSFLYLPNAIKNSGLTKITGNGSSISGYVTVSQMITQLKRDLINFRGRTFHFCYISTVDTISHKVGPYTDDAAMEIELIFMMLKEQLINSPSLPENTFLFISADHGHMVLDRKQIIDFRHDKELRSWMSAPVYGDPRAPFMRFEKGGIESAIEYLEERYPENFFPVKIPDLVRGGFFGNSRNNVERVDYLGDLVLIMKNSSSVFDYSLKILDPYNDGESMVGMHGGLSLEEMIVPFISRKIA